jgi:hypothetical protein
VSLALLLEGGLIPMKRTSLTVTVTFLSWCIVSSTISPAVSFAHASRSIKLELVAEYQIDPAKEPIAAALVKDGIWTSDPTRAPQLARDQRRAPKNLAIETRDNYFNHACAIDIGTTEKEEVERYVIDERERAYTEWEIFVHIRPDRSIPAII